MSLRWICFVLIAVVITGCAATSKYDKAAFYELRPRSILVLPPTNNSIEVNAPYTFLSTISEPLAEKGYYVFPVAVIDQLLKENGLPTPDEMHMIPLDKIRQHIGADAVLYVNISDWGQKFQIISSQTVVRAHMRLVDTRTATQLWEADVSATQDSTSPNQGGFLAAVANAVADQIIGSLTDHTPGIARNANRNAIYNHSQGLPDGPYRDELKHP